MNDDRLYPTLIKHCPCCGGDIEIMSKERQEWSGNTLIIKQPYVGIRCRICGLRTVYYDDIMEAVTKWNNRVGDD